MERRKTNINDIEREIYDFKNTVRYSYKAEKGLTSQIITEISREKMSRNG